MKSVDSGETGYLLRSLLMKDFYQFVLVVRLVSAHKNHVTIAARVKGCIRKKNLRSELRWVDLYHSRVNGFGARPRRKYRGSSC